MYKKKIIKALSIKQPWASLIATGKKTIETRTWKTNYRGELLIVSSKQMDENSPYPYFLSLGLPFGKAIAIAELVECRPMREEDDMVALSPWHPGLYAWVFGNIKTIEPFAVRGRPGLYEVHMREDSYEKLA